MTALHVAAVLGWVGFGIFVARRALHVANLSESCKSIINGVPNTPRFDPFLRRVDQTAPLPSKFSLVVRATIFGPLRLFVIWTLFLSAGLAAIACPTKYLLVVIQWIVHLLLRTLGVNVRHLGRRATGAEAPCLVTNHISALDMLVLLARDVAYVGNAGAKDTPCLGRVVRAMDCIFVDRDSPESRLLAKEMISERLISQHQSSGRTRLSQLVVFPEGTTTNGHGLLQFRRGAFEACVPIQPARIEYSNLQCSMSLVNLLDLICIIISLPSSEITIHYLPVIVPTPGTSADAIAETCRKAITSCQGVYSKENLTLFESGSHRDEHELAKLLRGS